MRVRHRILRLQIFLEPPSPNDVTIKKSILEKKKMGMPVGAVGQGQPRGRVRSQYDWEERWDAERFSETEKSMFGKEKGKRISATGGR